MTTSHLSRRFSHPTGQSDVDSDRIVVGVDGSRWGLAALTWAAGQARLADTDLDVCAAPADIHADGELSRRLTRIRADAGRRAIPVLPSQDAASALIAASRHAGLVVLGCQGSGHPGLGVGAAVPAVAGAAACDVAVVGGRPAAVRGAHQRIYVVLGSSASYGTVATAVRFALRSSARLCVLAQLSPAGRPPATPQPTESVWLPEAEVLARGLAPGLSVRTDVVVGEPHEVIAGIADGDLIVVDAHGPLDGLARAALYHARSPVLLARHR